MARVTKMIMKKDNAVSLLKVDIDLRQTNGGRSFVCIVPTAVHCQPRAQGSSDRGPSSERHLASRRHESSARLEARTSDGHQMATGGAVGTRPHARLLAKGACRWGLSLISL